MSFKEFLNNMTTCCPATPPRHTLYYKVCRNSRNAQSPKKSKTAANPRIPAAASTKARGAATAATATTTATAATTTATAATNRRYCGYGGASSSKFNRHFCC